MQFMYPNFSGFAAIFRFHHSHHSGVLLKLMPGDPIKLESLIFAAWLMFLAMAGFHPQALAQQVGVKDSEPRSVADEFFANGILHILKIEIPEAETQSLMRNPRVYVNATLREGATVYSNILIRLKGGYGSFRNLPDKAGFTIKLEAKNVAFHGLSKFHLNNAVQDGTYLSEWICSQMFREAGVPAARAAHAVVELNGRRLGLYVVLESVDQELLSRYSKNTRGNIYGQGPNADITESLERMGGNENNDGQDLKALAAACQESDVERLRIQLPQVLDLDRFLSFMAMETMLGHWDGYTFNVKNYMVYHNLDADKMVFIPHDLDQILRSTDEPIVPRARGAVSRAILKVPEFRERYRNRFEELFAKVFVAPVLAQRIDDRAAMLATQLESAAPSLAGDFVNHAGSLKSRLLDRARSLDAQLKFPETPALKFVADAASLTGWRIANTQEGAKAAQVQEASGKKTLWIAAERSTTASWRMKLVLAPGRYVFEGMARTAGVKPAPNNDRGEGAGLRISGRSRTAKLMGDTPWTKMLFEFEVAEAGAEIELVCELRAIQGEVWFDEASLRLLRR
jgi:hypothetical protein